MTKQIDKVRNYAYKMMNGDQTGHGFDHVQRVVNNSQKILQNETANAELVLTAAYLHDVFDDKLTDEVAGRKADVRRQLIAFGGVYDYPMYDPNETQVSHTKTEYRKPRATINHYEERMNEVIKRFNTDTGKEFAQYRFAVAEFIQQFKAEWENKEL